MTDTSQMSQDDIAAVERCKAGYERIRAELGMEAPVVATGGLARVFEPELTFVEAIDPGLTLEGLHLLWQKNRK